MKPETSPRTLTQANSPSTTRFSACDSSPTERIGRLLPSARVLSASVITDGRSALAQGAKKASVRDSMLWRGLASAGALGSAKAVWAVNRARPSASDS